jgi:hypothetical protein
MRKLSRTVHLDAWPLDFLRQVTREPFFRAENLDAWVWCLHCGHLMQVRDLAVSGRGWVGCPFVGCHASGFEVDLWLCDDGQNDGVFPPIGERSLGMVFW